MKYKIGDKVKIREDLGLITGVVASMTKYKGKIAEIMFIDKSGNIFRLDIDNGYLWSPEMLEPAEDWFDIGDLVKIKEDLEAGEKYGGYTFVIGMNKYKGKIAKIAYHVDDDYELDIDESEYTWSHEMLEPATEDWFDKLNVGDVLVNGTGSEAMVLGRHEKIVHISEFDDFEEAGIDCTKQDLERLGLKPKGEEETVTALEEMDKLKNQFFVDAQELVDKLHENQELLKEGKL